MGIDWTAPVGGIAELLACVPGLTANTVAQWQHRDRLGRRGKGRGKAVTYHAEDVLEIATRFEVSRLGLLPQYGAEIWAAVRGVMLTRQHPVEGAPTDQAIIFAREPGGQVKFRPFYESAPSNHPVHGSGINWPDAPDTFMMMRTGRFVDNMAARIAAVVPMTRRDVAGGVTP